jgi:hypothetical protein
LGSMLSLFVVVVSMLGLPSVSVAAGSPLIRSESPRQVSYESAIVEAQIDPVEAATTYRVEYGLDASYGMRAPASTDSVVGSGDEYMTVNQPLYGLLAGTTYHFRVVATNANGTTDGPDYVLRTPERPSSAADGCPNASMRALQHAYLLPDCRAYEMVSPVEKGGADIGAVPTRTQAAVDGNSIKYFSKTAFGDAIGSEYPGAEYIAKRGDEGWLTHSINPEQRSVYFATGKPSSYVGLSPDLSKGVFFAQTPVGSAHSNVEGLNNLYVRTDLQSPGVGNYELLSDAVAPQEAEKRLHFFDAPIVFDAASADWSRILFETDTNLTADTSNLDPTLPKLYEWHNGVVSYAGILPDDACQSPPCLATESIAGSGGGASGAFTEDWTTNSISADGSRVVFEANPLVRIYGGSTSVDAYQTFGKLYMRTDKTTTVQLNASERSTPDPRGQLPAHFLAATADDSKVFFESEEALTDNAEMPDNNLYMYEPNAPAGKHLKLITVDSEPNDNGGGYKRVVLVPHPAISQNGDFIYFFSTQNLIAGENQFDQLALTLYVWHDGSLRYVTHHVGRKNSLTEPYWGEGGVGRPGGDGFRMSADGEKIAFVSSTPSVAQQANVRYSGEETQVYVYNYDTDKISCASCNPSGALTTSNAEFEGQANSTLAKQVAYLSNAMSSDGRYVFFDTGDPLVAQDTNGKRDVYEYDTVTGEVHMLSDGTCDCDAIFAEASPDGSNVFIVTSQQLVKLDPDNNADMYDVRVDGGITSQNVMSPAPCEGEECRGPAAGSPTFSLPSSESFAGTGNTKPVPKVQVKRKRPMLVRALRACMHKPKKQRARCRARVRSAYHANRATRVRASRRAGR